MLTESQQMGYLLTVSPNRPNHLICIQVEKTLMTKLAIHADGSTQPENDKIYNFAIASTAPDRTGHQIGHRLNPY